MLLNCKEGGAASKAAAVAARRPGTLWRPRPPGAGVLGAQLAALPGRCAVSALQLGESGPRSTRQAGPRGEGQAWFRFSSRDSSEGGGSSQSLDACRSASQQPGEATSGDCAGEAGGAEARLQSCASQQRPRFGRCQQLQVPAGPQRLRL